MAARNQIVEELTLRSVFLAVSRSGAPTTSGDAGGTQVAFTNLQLRSLLDKDDLLCYFPNLLIDIAEQFSRSSPPPSQRCLSVVHRTQPHSTSTSSSTSLRFELNELVVRPLLCSRHDARTPIRLHSAVERSEDAPIRMIGPRQ